MRKKEALEIRTKFQENKQGGELVTEHGGKKEM